MDDQVKEIWEEISQKVANNLKVFLLQDHVQEILDSHGAKLDGISLKYIRSLPKHVAESEREDLILLAKLEFLETLKAWDPSRYPDVWPLARTRILGAMKDHIRYITRTDPSRFYEWVSDAAHMYEVVNARADFHVEIESGHDLNRLMSLLSYREQKVVLAHNMEGLTFREIGDAVGVSESQASRIYKKAIEKMRVELDKQDFL